MNHAPATYSRRTLLRRSAGLGGLVAASALAGPAAALAQVAPALVRSGRPSLTSGVQSGDVTATSGIVWARPDRPARMLVDVAASESFRDPRRLVGPIAGETSDFTAQLTLDDLSAGQDVFYRVTFADPYDDDLLGESVVGHFRTAPDDRRDVSFTWGGDVAGQGWGINEDIGGMVIFDTMRRLGPDFFLHSGDTIYADGPLEERVELPDGSVWTNLVTQEKSKVAETLDEFRGNHRYNLLDANVRRFNAEVPIIAQWDDHETTNNWYPGETLEDDRYRVTDVDLLAVRANRAFHEYLPVRQHLRQDDRIYRKVAYGPSLDLFVLDMRSYRGPNTANRQRSRSEVTEILGERQLRWLQRELAASTATWKVIASDLPIGLVVPDGEDTFEGIANDDGSRPLGREQEIADLLSFIHRRDIANVVWLTADVHYTAAHYYDPGKATFSDFTPFWEFVAGPLNAGTFGPSELDATFGPQVRFQKVPEEPNQPPSAGLQFFGHVQIDGETSVMTVRLVDLAGEELYAVELEPG